MATFRPSEQSLPYLDQLRYARRAIDLLEAEIKNGADVPSWVQQCIAKAATELGMGVSYLRRYEGKK